jgi:hypothetical protein
MSSLIEEVRMRDFHQLRGCSLRWLAAVACLLVCAAFAQAAESVRWATGRAFDQQLAAVVKVRANLPLRRLMQQLGKANGIAILVDRRIDPSRMVDISLERVSLETALRTIAKRLDLGVAKLGGVVYLGPTEVAEKLPSIAAALNGELRRFPPAAGRKFLAAAPMAWGDLATPRELLEGLGRENGLKIVGLSQVPHDLWASADLPPLPLLDRLLLVSVQFDLTFRLRGGGRQLELVPLPTK